MMKYKPPINKRIKSAIKKGAATLLLGSLLFSGINCKKTNLQNNATNNSRSKMRVEIKKDSVNQNNSKQIVVQSKNPNGNLYSNRGMLPLKKYKIYNISKNNDLSTFFKNKNCILMVDGYNPKCNDRVCNMRENATDQSRNAINHWLYSLESDKDANSKNDFTEKRKKILSNVSFGEISLIDFERSYRDSTIDLVDLPAILYYKNGRLLRITYGFSDYNRHIFEIENSISKFYLD